MKNDWLGLILLGAALGLVGVAPGCASADDDDTGDGDADSDTDGDGDGDTCAVVEETPPTCVPDGVDAAPELLEPNGCGGLSNHTIVLDVKVADTAARVHRDIAYPKFTISVSSSTPETFPVSSSLQALVNGCEIPPSATTQYAWTFEGDGVMNIVLSPSRYYVFEVRERGTAEEGARLFFRKALQMPSVLPNIQTPTTGQVLPAPGRNVSVPVTWDPFDLDEATWAVTKSIELAAWIQGGGANQLYQDPNVLRNIDGTRGQVTWSSGSFDNWDFIRMKASLFSDRQEESISINVVRSVN